MIYEGIISEYYFTDHSKYGSNKPTMGGAIDNSNLCLVNSYYCKISVGWEYLDYDALDDVYVRSVYVLRESFAYFYHFYVVLVTNVS
jgi:hypothetical protein